MLKKLKSTLIINGIGFGILLLCLPAVLGTGAAGLPGGSATIAAAWWLPAQSV